MDRPTLDILLQRATNNHAGFEQLAQDKQSAIDETSASLNRLMVELAHVRGALEYSHLVVAGLQQDVKTFDEQAAIAAKIAAELAAKSQQAEPKLPGPSV